MPKKVSAKITNSVSKISNIGDTLLSDEDLKDWEIDTIVLTSKTNAQDKIECSWVKENGKWVKRCVRV